MLKRGYRHVLAAIVFIAMTASCSKKSSSSSSLVANTSVVASSIEDLNLSGTLDLTVSDSVAGTGSSSLVGLVSGNKSAEACRVRQSIKQSTDMLAGIKSSICHIEAESSNVPFNTPVLLKLSGGADTGGGEGGPGGEGAGGEAPPGAPLASSEQLIGIYIDSTDAEAVKIYTCGGETKAKLKLDQMFRILAASDKRSKGDMFLEHEMGDATFAASVAYDSGYTEVNTNAMELKVKFSATFEGQENGFAQYLNMQLVTDGVSYFQNSDSGKWEGSKRQNAGVAVFDEENGQIVFSLDAVHDGEAVKESKRACVDGKGLMVSCQGAKFGEGKDLFVEADEVPGFLADDFTPTAPSGFDCETADWQEVDIDIATSENKEKHDACNETVDKFEQEDCWDPGYHASADQVDVPARDEVSGENRDSREKPLIPPQPK